jgi:predicted dehydrogenase
MIKIGFIGVGFVAQQCHLPSFDSVNGCKIIAISDLNEDLANKIGKRYEVNKVYYSHQELLEDEEIDAVIITVPRPLTADLCMQAIKYSKHVFVEKPISLAIDTGEKIIELAKEKKVAVQVGYMRRWDSAVIELTKIIEELRVCGKNPILVRAHSYAGDSYASPFGSFKSIMNKPSNASEVEKFPDWLTPSNTKAYENYLNIYSHTLDLVNKIMCGGLELKTSLIDNQGQGITLFQDKNKTPIELSTARSLMNEWNEGISFVYEDRIIELSLSAAFLRNVPGLIRVTEGSNESVIKSFRPKWSWAFRNQAINFIEICSNWPDSATNLISSVEQIKLVTDIFKIHECK